MARMTFYHKELLVNFIEMNRSMVRGKGRGDAAEAEEARRMWDEVATRLSAAGAVRRTGDEWKKVCDRGVYAQAWGELLCRTKKMARMHARSGDGRKKLTPLDHRIIAAGNGNLLLKDVNRDCSRAQSPESDGGVKAETVYTQELAAADEEDDQPLHPRLHAPERASEEQEGSGVLAAPSPPLAPSPTSPMHPTKRARLDPLETWEWPTWLAEVERTRAAAAAEAAAAARSQADALAQLAEATRAQADALLRIARALEDKFS